MLIKLIFFGPSIGGFALVILSCLLTRRLKWLLAAFIGGVMLHLISAVIQYQPLGAEPTAEQFTSAHDFAWFYFWVGLAVLPVPLLVKFTYIRFHPSKGDAG
jgi:hypothetical protein